MDKKLTRGASWNSAAIAGLIMAGVTIALAAIEGLTGRIGGFIGGFLHFLVWMFKVGGCIMTFKWLMEKFYDKYDPVETKELSNFGTKVAFFSAILVSAFSLGSILLVGTDTIMSSIRAASAQMPLDSNSQAALNKLMPMIPSVVFFVGLGYCFLWGWTLSSILSRTIAPDDPFSNLFQTDGNMTDRNREDDEPDDQDNQETTNNQ